MGRFNNSNHTRTWVLVIQGRVGGQSNKMRYLLLILLFIGCNPVKQVMSDKEKFDQVAEEVIRRGYCVNDTVVIEKIKDSIVYRDSIVEVIKRVPCLDFDTTIRRARIRVSSGVLTYTAQDSIIYRVRTITNNIRDLSRENILAKDVAERDGTITSLRSQVKEKEELNKSIRKDLRNANIKFWLVIISALIVIFRKTISRLAVGFI